MAEGGSLINLGELSKPATVLVEKISDAIGGIFRPYQIRRVAQAEAEADKVRAVSQIEISELQRRAVQRFFIEEANKQHNMESIAEKALPEILENAKPEEMEDDWITNFFDKCRLISDQKMQLLWSSVLAGEANTPGRFSKRTISLLSTLDKSDAELFRILCSYAWSKDGSALPLIFDMENPIYTGAGINFSALKHLDSIGLLSFESLSGYAQNNLNSTELLEYYGRVVSIEFPNPDVGMLDMGHVMLSKAGEELSAICGSSPCAGFADFVIEQWRARGMIVKEQS
jgi:hypothetical protein